MVSDFCMELFRTDGIHGKTGKCPVRSNTLGCFRRCSVFGIALIYFCIHIGSVRVKSA